MNVRLTERLRLEPIEVRHASELLRIHADPAVAYWYGGAYDERQAAARAETFARGWEHDGASKWMAYDRTSGDLVGRGGLSFAPVDGERRLELGWALLSERWGQGYASEIGREGLAFAFDELGAPEVVAFTERVNTRSIAVMERIGMRLEHEFVGEGLVEGREGVHPDAVFVVYRASSDATSRFGATSL